MAAATRTHNMKPNTHIKKAKSQTHAMQEKKQSKEGKIGIYSRQERKIEKKNVQTNFKLKTFYFLFAVHLYQAPDRENSLQLLDNSSGVACVKSQLYKHLFQWLIFTGIGSWATFLLVVIPNTDIAQTSCQWCGR